MVGIWERGVTFIERAWMNAAAARIREYFFEYRIVGKI